MPAMPTDYSLAQAAELLGLSPGTLNVQARRGRLRARKIGDRWIVSAAEVERYRRDVLGKPGWTAKVKPDAPSAVAAPSAPARVTFCPAPKPSQRKRRAR
jgi:excisionase family DNA binding protein